MNRKSLGDRQTEQSLNNLSEFEGAKLLAGYGIPTAKAMLAHDWEAVKWAGKTIGYPVVLKLSSSEISHKTEKGGVAEMLQEIKGNKILDRVRGMPAVNRESLIGCLMAVGKIGLERADIMAIDINPLIVRQGEPVAVDALVVLRQI